MKIAILGAGAMGMLFGSYLSRENEVILLEKSEERVKAINENGITVREKTGDVQFAVPAAQIDRYCGEPVDLMLVFVKAMFERDALESAKALLGPDTYLMTLQNGEGHEAVLKEFAKAERVIIGTTQDNSSLLGESAVHHGGAGKTYFGLVSGNSETLAPLAALFTRCGFEAEAAENCKRLIWNKLFLNASASALTALFLCSLGFIVEDAAAKSLCTLLIAEAVAVANADGQSFDCAAVTEEIFAHLARSRDGFTSIYADVKAGRRSEVDTISGAVVKAGQRLGVATPNMAFVVQAIHAMEHRMAQN